MTDRRAWLLLIIALVLLAAIPSAAVAQTRFVFANESPYDTMDPHAAFDVGRVAVRLNLYDGLYRWLDNPPMLTPWLAESHTVSADGLTYTFKLRHGAKFHDGAEITAEDVRYSMERILALKKGAASLLATMVAPGATKAIDRHTVAVHARPSPPSIFLAVVPEVHVVNSALLKKNEKDGDWGGAWLTSNDAGSGSYALSRYDPALGFIAKRFPGHFHAVGRQVHRRDRVPAREGGQHPRARHDQGRLPGHRRLPAHRPGQAPARGAERQDRRAGVDAHHDLPGQQPARAAHRRERAPRHQLRLRLRRVQQGHPERLGGAQPGADPEQPLGRAARREGLQLRHRQGQGRARQGQAQGRPPAHRRLPAPGSARPSRRPP